MVDVHSRPGRISLVLGDVDRSDVAIDDMLLILETPALSGRSRMP
jgi:hypothetical protein